MSIIKDLQFGELNNIKRNDINPSGDRRRTSTTTAIRFATEKAFEVNTLSGVSSFVGIVVGARVISRAVSEYKDTIIVQKDVGSTGAAEIGNYLYKVYIPELEPLPAPESYEDPVIGLYADIGAAKGMLTSEIAAGAMVEVTYSDVANLKGPQITRLISNQVGGGLDMGVAPSLKSDWGSGTGNVVVIGGESQRSPKPPGVGPEARNKGPKLTAAQLKPIRHLFMPILDAISKAESRTNSYDAGNRPKNHADGSYAGIKMTDKLFPGRDIATVTFQEIRDQMSAKQLFASGRYQIVPNTFDEHLGYTGLQLTDFYNPVNQDLFGIELLLHRRGRAGNYLAGKTEDVIGAGESLSYEWAGLPVQWDGQKKHAFVYRGGSYYSGDTINNSHAQADEIISALRKTRANLDGSPEAQALFNK